MFGPRRRSEAERAARRLRMRQTQREAAGIVARLLGMQWQAPAPGVGPSVDRPPVFTTPRLLYQTVMATALTVPLLTGTVTLPPWATPPAWYPFFVAGWIALTLWGWADLVFPAAVHRTNPRTVLRAGYACIVAAFLSMTLSVGLLVSAPMQSNSRTVSSLSNLKQIELGVLMYAQDNDDRLPPMDSVATVRRLTAPYLKYPQLWHVPGVHEGTETYTVNPILSYRTLKDVPNAANVAMVYEANAWHRGSRDRRRVIGYVDGNVRVIPEQEWPAIRQASGIGPEPRSPALAPWWAFWRSGPRAAIPHAVLGNFCTVLWAVFTFLSAGLCAAAERGGRRQNWFGTFVAGLIVITLAIGTVGSIAGFLVGEFLLTLMGIS